ncbi:MAG TPA: glycosyltransferase family 4 protein [Solirubrobacteraceae bacterium]|nr:glycosyltransferase family 4 protein [Solirubrobacteraceae bacterium]
MRVHVIDPASYTPPYDDALCRALAALGAQVELQTGRFAYAPLPPPEGYVRNERFYRHARSRAAKLAWHLPEMLRYGAELPHVDVAHFQWLPAQPLDLIALRSWRLLARRGKRRLPPLVLSAHDILPREALPGQRAAQRALYACFEAIVVHSEQGRRRLLAELPDAADRVHVIPHGALQVRLPAGEQVRLPRELGSRPAVPLVLFAGLLRPYKGLDVLLDAWRMIQERPQAPPGELWIAGMPRMELRALSRSLPQRTRLLARFLTDAELAGLLQAADLVVLPYRELESSGLAMLALGLGRPMLCSDRGAFPELEQAGAARCVGIEAPEPLAEALAQLLGDEGARERLAAGARAAAAGRFSWQRIGEATLALYRSLLEEGDRHGREGKQR